MMAILRGCHDGSSSAAVALVNKNVRPILCVKVPGGAAAWQIIVSRNGKHILINSADCSLRLFDVEELSKTFCDHIDGRGDIKYDTTYPRITDIKPRFVFQDNISKVNLLDWLSSSRCNLG